MVFYLEEEEHYIILSENFEFTEDVSRDFNLGEIFVKEATNETF